MKITTLSYDRSGQIIVCPHRGEAVPDSAVYVKILDSAGDEVATSTAATKSTFSTTLSSVASAGSRSITVASTSGLSVGHPVVLTDSHGRTDLTEAVGVDASAATIALADRLSRAYAAGSAVVGARISHTLDLSDEDTWLRGFYQAVWYCADWADRRLTIFRVVETPTSNPIEFDDVRRFLRHVSVIRDSYDQDDLQDDRDSAWEFIRADILAAGRDPEVYRTARELGLAGGVLAAALFLTQHGQFEVAERYAGNPLGTGGFYVTYMSRLIQIPGWFDDDQDLSVDQLEKKRPMNRRLRRGL